MNTPETLKEFWDGLSTEAQDKLTQDFLELTAKKMPEDILKIVNFLEKSTITEDLKKRVVTEAQFIQWSRSHCLLPIQALVWRTKFIEGCDDLLMWAVKNKLMDRTIANYIWHTVDWHEQMWRLIQVANPYVKKEVEKAGYEYSITDIDLFCKILYELHAMQLSICFEPYVEVSSQKHEKVCRLAVKQSKEELTPNEKALCQKVFNKINQPLVLLPFVLDVCRSKIGKRRTPLKSKLEDFYTTFARVCEVEATIRRKTGSFAWNKGEVIKARIGGNYSKT